MKDKLFERLCSMYDDIYGDMPYKTKTVAFLIYKNKIVSFGVNSEKTSPMQSYFRRKAGFSSKDFIYDKLHAEIDCLKRVDYNFSKWCKSEIVVLSKKKDGNFRLSRPCPICRKALEEKGIKNIWFSDENNKIVKEEGYEEICS